jgi:branched-chain amino acid transport system substrate-binding protein
MIEKRIRILLPVFIGLMVTLSLGFATFTEAAPPIKIGVVSEWDFVGGQGIKRGAERAIEEINSTGGLLGRKVEGVFYDDKCDPGEAKNATERLLYSDKVDVICGFWRSDLAIVCQPVVMEAKKILLLGGAASPMLTVDRIKKDYNTYKYTFTGASHAFQNVIGIAQGINSSLKLGLGKIAVMVEQAAWAGPVYDYLLKKYSEKIVYSTRFSTAATDFSVEFAQVKAKDADILCLVSTGRGGTAAVKQWYDMRVPAVFVGHPEHALDPNFWKITEGKCQGVVAQSVGGIMGLPITAKSIPFYNNYYKAYGEYPIGHTLGQAYDIVMVWAQSVKHAGTIESDAVVRAMEKKDLNYVGVSGVLERFDETHVPTGGGWKKGEPWSWVCFQWQNGKREIFWPEAVKTKDMIIPDWVQKLRRK